VEKQRNRKRHRSWLVLLQEWLVIGYKGPYDVAPQSTGDSPRERGVSVDHTTVFPWVQGYEVIHMLRKGQIEGIVRRDVLAQNRVINQVFGVAA
jgi:hypothetical protein